MVDYRHHYAIQEVARWYEYVAFMSRSTLPINKNITVSSMHVKKIIIKEFIVSYNIMVKIPIFIFKFAKTISNSYTYYLMSIEREVCIYRPNHHISVIFTFNFFFFHSALPISYFSKIYKPYTRIFTCIHKYTSGIISSISVDGLGNIINKL